MITPLDLPLFLILAAGVVAARRLARAGRHRRAAAVQLVVVPSLLAAYAAGLAIHLLLTAPGPTPP